jgi:uncharacterized membrane-anchored protein
MTGWLRGVLVAQLAFFGIWGGMLLTSHRDVAVVWLATEPIDPRDLLSGHYVALRFEIAVPTKAGCPSPENGGPRRVWVQLSPVGEPVTTGQGLRAISEPVDCRTTPPDDPEHQVWITGEMGDASGAGRIVYGIERFYVGEGSPLRYAQSGSIVGEVAINDGFEPRVLGLLTRERPTAIPPPSP